MAKTEAKTEVKEKEPTTGEIKEKLGVKGSKPGKIRHVCIDIASNGFEISVDRETGGKGFNEMYGPSSRDKLVFQDKAAMLDHLKGVL